MYVEIAIRFLGQQRAPRSRTPAGNRNGEPWNVAGTDRPMRSAIDHAPLRRAIISIDREDNGAGARDPEAVLGAWRGLVDGRWLLVDRFDHGERRFLVARGSDPTFPPARALSQRELQIAGYAALGHSNKEIAYALGLAASTVSSHLRSAMRRLGLRDRAALLDIFFVRLLEDDERLA
jgi:DNA-binding CsgD family transcriptional regulator